MSKEIRTNMRGARELSRASYSPPILEPNLLPWRNRQRRLRGLPELWWLLRRCWGERPGDQSSSSASWWYQRRLGLLEYTNTTRHVRCGLVMFFKLSALQSSPGITVRIAQLVCNIVSLSNISTMLFGHHDVSTMLIVSHSSLQPRYLWGCGKLRGKNKEAGASCEYCSPQPLPSFLAMFVLSIQVLYSRQTHS